MTNREKFIEVFGFNPDYEENILPCTKECPLYIECKESATCIGWSWWGREYHSCETCLHFEVPMFPCDPCLEGIEDRWQKKEKLNDDSKGTDQEVNGLRNGR